MDSTLNSYDYVASVTALQAAQYQMVVPTLEDSTASGMHRFTYVVVAHNTSLSDHTTSAPDSGYSVDNLSPIPPAGLLAVAQAGPQVELSWSAPVDPDVRSYTVYRSAVAGFTPLPEHVIGTSFSTSFLDASPAAGEVSYYRIVALDIHGNPSPPSGEVAAAVAVTRQFSVAEKWNMVSVPLTVGDYAKSLLFPTATTNAFAYDLGYAAYGILENGRGYWMKFTSDEIVSMSGLVRTLDTVEVAEGWNMVGSVSVPVPVSQIASIPGGIVTGSFFGYHGGYQASATLEPGKGYWVKSTQAGRLILDGTLSTPPANRIRIAESGEMPPPPPQGEAASLIGAPVDYELSQNYPNPFNPRTTIEYALPFAGHVALKVYNALGQEVASLVDGVQEAGRRKAQFDADGLPSGIYICRLTAGTFVEVRKMVLTQ
jgi:hypothetical protein